MIALDTLCSHCMQTWNAVNSQSITLDSISIEEQKANEQRIWDLLSQESYFRSNPNRLREYLAQDAIWNLQQLPQYQQEEFCQITRQFILDAKAFDDQLQDEAIFQALRNVWIILMLEMLLRNELSYHSAIFSYSMLYPYTDNYLDDPAVSEEDKQRFNKRLRKRLQGISYEGPSSYEYKIDRLVAGIEAVFDRAAYPQVYESLLCIQKGQEDSLQQTALSDHLLAVSIQKGGSSVLADGFLIDGRLSEEEQKFCMEYGFSLQLADDLQDMNEDRISGHFTVFSNQDVEELAKKLLQYIHEMLQRQTVCKDQKLIEVIKKGCQLLVLGSIIMQRDKFSNTFMKKVFSCFPVTKSGLKKLMSSGRLSTSELMDMFINEKDCNGYYNPKKSTLCL